MRVTLGQKLQLGGVFLIIRILWIIDDIGFVIRKSLSNTLRLGLYLIVVTTALTGFYVKSYDSGFQNIPSVLNPTTPSVLGAVGLLPEKEIPLPDISAVSVYAVELKSGTVLLDINSDFELAPASTTKLMTALVALDLYSLEDSLEVPEFCTEIEGLKAGFFAGDSYKVKNLLYSLLVNSSADAACTLAVGKTAYNDFVEAMNIKAKEMGLSGTFFTNPVGLDGTDGSHHSTAKDLYLLAKEAVSHDIIRKIVGTKEVDVVSNSGFSTHLVNTNDLLWTQPGTVGIKTGRTEEAGEVFIYGYEPDDKSIIITTMRGTDRFGDTLKLLDWISSSYGWSN